MNPRAAKACSSCRARKVRCDVTQTGPPCTKCQVDNFECSVQPRKKRRKQGDNTLATGKLQHSQVAFPEHVMRHKIPHYNFFQSFAPTGKPRLQSQNQDGLLLPVSPHDSSAGESRADDLHFLQQKGVFNLPPKLILDECVSAYFKYFHNFFPVLDRRSFLDNYESCDEESVKQGKGPSFLLLQAVIFTAISLISDANILAMGFSSRQQARSCVHSKARHIHNFNYESDDIITIQALLLISHYYPSMAEQRHTWIWVHQAIGLAQGLGLHRITSGPNQKLWSRIWWSCLIRDRLITLGTRRPMHINSLDCNVPLLTHDDLEEEGDTGTDTAIKAIFVDFTKLCYYMEGILSLPFAASESLPGQISICESTLQHWSRNLNLASRPEGTLDSQITSLYKGLLHLVFNVVRISLQQSGSSHLEQSSCNAPSFEVQKISSESIHIMSQLIESGMVGYCPTQTVTTVLPPLIVQLLVIRCSSEIESPAVTDGFGVCMDFLKRLGGIYWHASFYHQYFKLVASSLTPAIRLDVQDPADHTELPHGDSCSEGTQLQLDDYEVRETGSLMFGSTSELLDSEAGTFQDASWAEPRDLDLDGHFAAWLDDYALFQSLFPSA